MQVQWTVKHSVPAPQPFTPELSKVLAPGALQLVAPWQYPHTLPQVPPCCPTAVYPSDWQIASG